ncbi:MAG TPA: hypothetical protein VK211_19295 [Kamptonema sp.]|nr:hypothetical protein [Kamptonema sp.]
MKHSNFFLLSVAFLVLSGIATVEAAYAEPSPPTTETKVPVSPMSRQSSNRFSTPATYTSPNGQPNDRPLCFYQGVDGAIVDLSKLCGVKSTETVTNPVLQNAPINNGNTEPYW